jgi:hypothetical protein
LFSARAQWNYGKNPSYATATPSLNDTEDENDDRNIDKPEGNKKAKERLKLEGEGEAALLRDKF